MYYVYVLKSETCDELNIGSTNDLKRRLQEHNLGKNFYTKRYQPWSLVYFEAYILEKLARLREKRLKHHGNAVKELKKRIGLTSNSRLKSGAGFTLIELLLVMGIFAILAAFATVNLLRPQTQASVDSTTQVLSADIKGQQLKTMAGDTEGQAAPAPGSQGIYFEATRYTLFQGSAYSAGDPSNKVFDLESNLALTNISFPSSQVVFLRRSGEVTGFVAGSDSVTVRNTQSGEQKTITVNRYGAIVIN